MGSVRRATVLLLAAASLVAVAVPWSASPVLPPDGWAKAIDPGGISASVEPSLSGFGFTENVGQVRNPEIRFYASSNGMRIGFAAGAVLLVVDPPAPAPAPVPWSSASPAGAPSEPATTTRHVLVRLAFVGARAAEPRGVDELLHRSNYFLGKDPSGWRTDVRSYREVVYEDLYDGIDLAYGSADGRLKYEFRVRPGADPARIEMAYEGLDRLRLDPDGGLIAPTAAGEVRDLPPTAFQGADRVPCPFAIRGPASVGFACEGWDASRALVIDPLVYATFLGGAGHEELYDLVTDAQGFAYLAGMTYSPDFPVTPGAWDVSLDGTADGYIAKLAPDGGSLEWATFFGGTASWDFPGNIAVDSSGNVVVVGQTKSSDFPVTAGSFDVTFGDSFGAEPDGYAAKFTGNGRLVWSTYLGGADGDNIHGLDLDEVGNVIVGGWTQSSDFPVTPGVFQASFAGTWDAIVAKLDSAGRSLLWATFLGGTSADYVESVVTEPGGGVVATGLTYSTDFPVTPGAWDETPNGWVDAFNARLGPGGTALVWATYFGGLDLDAGFSLALDGAGAFYTGGGTYSPDFPVTAGAFDESLDGLSDGYVAKWALASGDLVWATFLGGGGSDGVGRVSLDGAGNVCVSGLTGSPDFPVTPGAWDATLNGSSDAFLAKLNPAGSGLVYATLLGGDGIDTAVGGFVDAVGDAYVAGFTTSADFPVTPGAFQTAYGGGGDAFVVKLRPVVPGGTPPRLSWTGEPNYAVDGLDPEAGTNRTRFAYRVLYSDADDQAPTQIRVRIEKPLGSPWGTLPIAFDRWAGAPNDYVAGAIYATNVSLPAGTDFWYSFNATDGWAWATGPPTLPTDAPDVVADDPPTAVASASTTNASLGEAVAFDGTASTDDVGIAAYLWDFGDGAMDGNATVVHAYGSRGTFLATLTVWDTANQSDADSVTVNVVNRPPVADAGPEQSAVKYVPVQLDGSASADPDGDPLTHAWSQVSGPPVALAGADTATPTFTPLASGTYGFMLTVEDGWGGSANDTVTVTVPNRGPVAAAGPDRTVPKKVPVALDGTGSSDPDGDPLTFAWSQLGGPAVALSGGDTATPTFTPPVGGTYVFALIVDDGDGGVARDEVWITAVNGDPRADAGADRTAAKRTTVVLDGSNSSDPDGDPLTFAWSQVGGPPVPLSGGDTAAPTFTPSVGGTYVFELAVGDGDGGIATDRVAVTAVNAGPTADAGPDRTAVKRSVVVLDGSTSSDPDGDALTFLWTQTGGPPVAVGDAATARATFVPNVGGTYAFRLQVSDGDGGVAEDAVQFTVPNAPPIADAGPDRIVRKGVPVTLDGARSSDPDGDPLTYGWTQTSGPPVPLARGDTAAPEFTPTRAGAYEFRLLVRDSDGAEGQDSVLVVAWGLPPMAVLAADATEAFVGVPIAFDGGGSYDPDGTIVAYAFDLGDGARSEGMQATAAHAYASPGAYEVVLRVRDDDGNVSTDRITVTVRAFPSAREPNWKPVVASVFASVLTVVGAWFSRRAPGPAGSRPTLRAFAFTTLPFVVAEAGTGVVSLLTGLLAIPPLVGMGTAVDLGILVAGLAASTYRVRKRTPPR